MTTASGCSFARAGLRATIGSLVLATCLGIAGTAVAGPDRHHVQPVRDDFNALVTPGPASGLSIGSWRYGTFRNGGCDRTYPMHEASPCGSVTGGPVGGMGS